VNFGKSRTLGKSDDPLAASIESARRAVREYAEDELRIAEFEAAVNAAKESAVVGDGLKIAGQIQDLDLMRRDSERKRARAVEVISEIFGAASEAERAVAASKRATREQLLEKVTAALEVLSKLEDVTFTRFITRAQPVGLWEPRLGTVANLESGSPNDIYPATGAASYAVPMSERLSAEITAHEQRAAELETRQVDASGDLNEALETVVREPAPPAVKAVEAA
jgi:hypothetical protein